MECNNCFPVQNHMWNNGYKPVWLSGPSNVAVNLPPIPKNWSQLAHHQANLARETIHAKEDEIAGGSGALLHRLLHHTRLLLSDLNHGAAGDRSSGGRTNQQGLTRPGKTSTCQSKVRISWSSSTKRIYPTMYIALGQNAVFDRHNTL